jgi:hypothetical protein
MKADGKTKTEKKREMTEKSYTLKVKMAMSDIDRIRISVLGSGDPVR